jgi:XTP/dITP diphosphohydrolase
MAAPLIVASSNPGKVREFEHFFQGLERFGDRWQLHLKPADLEVEETGSTFAENALLKARSVAIACRQWAIADDSGLAVDALAGAPGVYSARYSPTTETRIARLLQELEGIPQRGAEFVCAIALCQPDGTLAASAVGRRRGEILKTAKGRGGFGYDPVFYVPDAGLTFAEMSPPQKQQWGHRGLALGELHQQLMQLDLSTAPSES